MKILKRLRIIPFFIFLLIGLITPAQTVTNKPLNFEFTLRNIHSWRGQIYSNSPAITAELFHTFNSGFKVGAWSGYSFDKEYTDINYYVGWDIPHSGFAVSVYCDPSSHGSHDIFDSHTDYLSWLDVSYTLQNERFPIKLLFSPMVSGRDTYVNKKGKKKNRHSSYLELSMPVYKKKNQSITLGAGGAFALADSDSNFYGDHDNLVNLFIEYDSFIKLLKYNMPIFIKTFWNPEAHNVALQVSFELF